MAPRIVQLHSQVFATLIASSTLFLAIIHPSLAHSRKLFESPLEPANSSHFGSLDEVRLYLERFGYKEKFPGDPNGSNSTEASLFAAISLYQEKNHLNVTGKLDPETEAAMMTPRCGMPDIFPADHYHHHHGGGKLFHAVAHYSFFRNMHPWTKRDMTYRFKYTAPRVSLADLRAIFDRVFQRWSAVTTFKFREAGNGERADISIGFFTWNHGDGKPFDGPGHVVAHAFAPQDGRLHFDGSEHWSTVNPTRTQIDLESVAMHEMGHILGLMHSTVKNAIMYPSFHPGGIKRELQKDDIDGIHALYHSK
ncbi:hypothetical protein SAY86_007756 [Trapa natans]|uniref:Peptidase metallopeptidase domain-containing protein n=1 Tax=Trapa natans TaxID=22666 RepID=A0AAN7LPJ3_TRANT|nr:hypothetical protein SAY86_007756 [Trapa natans]